MLRPDPAAATKSPFAIDDLESRICLSASLPTLGSARVFAPMLSHHAGSGQTVVPLAHTTGQAAADAQFLQQDASGGMLEQFISQLAILQTSRADIKQYAQSVLAAHNATDQSAQAIATALKVTLPTQIDQATDQVDANAVIAAVGTPNFDQVYLQTMVQINTADYSTSRSEEGATGNRGIRNYAKHTANIDKTHYTEAQTLLNTSTT